MSFLQTYAKEIVSLLIPFLVWALNRFLRSRARLQLSQPHNFTFLLNQPLLDANGIKVREKQGVHTRSFMVKNAGSDTATKVEMVFNWKPMYLNIWPPRHFAEHTELDNRYVIIFDSLSPNEVVGCETLSINADLPILVTVRSDQAVAKTIEMYPQPVISNSVRNFLILLCGLGLATLVYGVLLLIQYLVLKTPLGH